MSDEFEGRAALMEFEGGLPRTWAGFLARLCTMPKPEGYLLDRWEIIKRDACLLVDKWHKRLDANGWGPDDIRRLLVLIGGREVVSVGMADVTLQMPGGATEKAFWRPNPGGIARWDAGRRAA